MHSKLYYLRVIMILVILISSTISAVGVPEKKVDGSEYIVKIKEKSNPKALGLSYKKVVEKTNDKGKKLGLDRLYVVKVKDNKVIGKLIHNPHVEYIEPNYEFEINVIPNDVDFGELYGMHNTGQTYGTEDADIDAPEAWDITTGSRDVIIAVIDTGVDYNHVDLKENIFVNDNEIPGNGIDDDSNGFVDDVKGWDFYQDDSDAMDDHGHGTHCAGTIAGVGNNDIGVVGVMWQAKILPIKFLSSSGRGLSSDAVAAVNYAIMMDVDVMSNSWGGGGYSTALRDAIQAASNAGIAFVAAAGNSGRNNDYYAHYPSSYDVDNIIAVAATDHNDNLAYFSNYGANSVDIAAPGVRIYSTVPSGSCTLCTSSGYKKISGTSMATPHVAGVVGLVKSQFPGMIQVEIKQTMLENGDVLNSLSGKVLSNSRINAFQALMGSENDEIPPATIDNLVILERTMDSIMLQWSAVGDDELNGTAVKYELEYSNDNANYNLENLNIKPKGAGEIESYVFDAIAQEDYYFRIRAIDNKANRGSDSNVAYSEKFTDNYPPVADADGPYTGLEKQSISFDASNSYDNEGDSLIYTWIIGNMTKQGMVVEHTFDTPGKYSVTLIVNDGMFDDIDTTYTDIIVDEDKYPVARTSGPYWGKEGYAVEFDGSRSFDPKNGTLTYLWDFGDGSIAEGMIVERTYQSHGTFDISLTVANGEFEDIDYSYVEIEENINHAPYAYANVPYSGTATFQIDFDASASYDPDGDALTYLWTFGDGATSNGINPTHIYANVGNYNVTLTVSDGEFSDTDVDTIEIRENQKPVAKMSGPTKAREDTLIEFIAKYSYDPEGKALTYNWDFGDGTTTEGFNVSHSYENEGDYTITLIVNDGYQDSDSVTKNISILRWNYAPVVKMNGPYEGTIYSSIYFSASGTSDQDYDSLTYLWDFGDGNTSDKSIIRYQYSEPGDYTVTLTVSDGKEEVVKTTTAHITDPNTPPVADAGDDEVYYNPNGNAEEYVVLESKSYDPDQRSLKHEWTLNGEIIGTSSRFGFYIPIGVHEITLKVTDSYGATDSDVVIITLMDNIDPTAVANVDRNPAYIEETLSFNSEESSDEDGLIKTREWSFGDGTTSSERNPSHVYSEPGDYEVTLTVEDYGGKISTDSLTVTIKPKPIEITAIDHSAKARRDRKVQAVVFDLTLKFRIDAGSSDNLIVYEDPSYPTPTSSFTLGSNEVKVKIGKKETYSAPISLDGQKWKIDLSGINFESGDIVTVSDIRLLTGHGGGKSFRAQIYSGDFFAADGGVAFSGVRA